MAANGADPMTPAERTAIAARVNWPTPVQEHGTHPSDGIVQCREDRAALLAENEALRDALEFLLLDTQHDEHDCGDTVENCPVLKARAALTVSEEAT